MFKDTESETASTGDLVDDASVPALPHALNAAFAKLDPVGRLRLLADRIDGNLVFTTSFGLEDQALTHLIHKAGIDVAFVTLDTGRLFQQTYDVWAETEARYGIQIRPFYPRAGATEALIAAQGINGFRNSVAERKACCAVRKLQPLKRALDGAAAWITGVRADQTANRGDMTFVSADADWGVLKANPLLDWSRQKVAALVAKHAIPANALHSQGFPSIGCAPCTRAVSANEPERAGRWWWESDGSQECGLHMTADGRLVRAGAAR